MADAANAGGGTPSATHVEAPVQTEYQPPEGKVLLDASEHAVLKQNNERVRGMQGYYEAGAKYGLKKPEDFESVGRFRKFEENLKGRGLTMEQIEQAFTVQESEAQQAASLDVAALEKQFGEKFVPADKFTKELDRRDALRDHNSASDREAGMLKNAIAELAGENASTRDKWLIENAVKAVIDESRTLYPKDHPLHESHLAALDEKGIAAVVERVKKEIAVSDGADMAAVGKKAAASKSVATPAGNKASQGKATEEDKSASGMDRIRAATERFAKQAGLT